MTILSISYDTYPLNLSCIAALKVRFLKKARFSFLIWQVFVNGLP